MKPKKPLPKEAEPFKFKPGVSGNPKGRPLITQEQRELRKLSIEKLREVIEIALTGNLEELKDLVSNPKTPAIQVGFATAILKSIKDGDPTVLERLSERLVGKISEIINVTTVNTTTVQAQVATLTDEQIKLRIKKLESDV